MKLSAAQQEPLDEKGYAYFTDIVKKYWPELDNLLWGLIDSTSMKSIGEEISQRHDLIHPIGLAQFSDALEEYSFNHPHTHMLVTGNHPDFQSCEMQNPLWIFEILAKMACVTKKDPYAFVSGKVVPNIAERIYPRLFIVDKDNLPHENVDILCRAMNLIKGKSPQAYFILPEGRNSRNDILTKARSGGVSLFIETALENNVSLSIFPIGLEQRLVSRGEIKGQDEYRIRTGPIIRAEDIPKPNLRHKQMHEFYADYIMRQIAGLVPIHKRGYYK